MLTFYANPISSNSQKVHLFLEETGIPYKMQIIDLMKGEHLRSPYKDINPFEAVPAIEHEGFKLSESNTILRYLAQRFGQANFYPANLEDQARVDQAMDFVSIHVSRWIAALNWYRVIAPFLGIKENSGAIQEAHQNLRRYLPRLEAYLATKTSYLCGSHPTIADVSFAPLAAQAKQLGVSFRDVPLVAAYIDRLISRPAWQEITSDTPVTPRN